MTDLCAAPNPLDPSMTCTKNKPCANQHVHSVFDEIECAMVNKAAWPNAFETSVTAVTKKPRTKKMLDMKARAKPETRANGIPAQAQEAWSQDEWVERTKADLLAFLREREEPFTTPEHFWPTIDAPAEMRALSVVVQHAIRSSWIAEEGAVRLRETYRTRDGVEFPINKLVPVYRSLIYAPASV